MKSKKQFSPSDETILLKMEPTHIDFFNKLIEGYDNLALVTTIDAKLGEVALRVTDYTKKDILAILHCLPIPLSVVSTK